MNNMKTLLLTASGILIAILLVWAQLWTTTAQYYHDHGYGLITVGYGLLLVYYAMVASVFSFIAVLFNKFRLGTFFLLFTVAITGVEVLTSTWSVFSKIWTDVDNSLLAPSEWGISFLSSDPTLKKWLFLIVTPIITLVVLWWLVYTLQCTRNLVSRVLNINDPPKEAERSPEEMQKEKTGEKPSIAQSQFARLNFFLISSSFLVAAFIALVTSDSQLLNWQVWWFTFLVASLGLLLAILHTFMNLWEWLHSDENLVHTWLTPFVFVLFWILAWIVYNDWDGWVIVLSLIITVLIFFGLWLYERHRNKFHLKSWLKCLLLPNQNKRAK